jgi:hypothetical protein
MRDKWDNAVETTRTDLVQFGAAPGKYIFVCRYCDSSAIGAKHSWRCEPCAVIVFENDKLLEEMHFAMVSARATD